MSSSDCSASGEDTSVLMKVTVKSIRLRFPKVLTVSTGTVSDWLNASQEKVMLLDVREKEEYDVSHIAGSLKVSPDMDDIASTVATNREIVTEDLKIVCYCSIGYRSSAYAQALTNWFDKECSKASHMIIPTVYNMEGSIFKWANENKPMVNDKGKTIFAHPYDRVFGKLLKREFRRSLTEH